VLLLELAVVLLRLEGLLHQGVRLHQGVLLGHLLHLLGQVLRLLGQVLLVQVLEPVVGPVAAELVRFLQL
jgi:hypothetical protein